LKKFYRLGTQRQQVRKSAAQAHILRNTVNRRTLLDASRLGRISRQQATNPERQDKDCQQDGSSQIQLDSRLLAIWSSVSPAFNLFPLAPRLSYKPLTAAAAGLVAAFTDRIERTFQAYAAGVTGSGRSGIYGNQVPCSKGDHKGH
jgi:hypothetical protein